MVEEGVGVWGTGKLGGWKFGASISVAFLLVKMSLSYLVSRTIKKREQEMALNVLRTNKQPGTWGRGELNITGSVGTFT